MRTIKESAQTCRLCSILHQGINFFYRDIHEDDIQIESPVWNEDPDDSGHGNELKQEVQTDQRSLSNNESQPDDES